MEKGEFKCLDKMKLEECCLAVQALQSGLLIGVLQNFTKMSGIFTMHVLSLGTDRGFMKSHRFTTFSLDHVFHVIVIPFNLLYL